MAFHLIAFTKSQSATSYAALNNIPDSASTLNGTTLYTLSSPMTNIVAAYGSGGGSGNILQRFRLVSPSILKDTGNYYQTDKVDAGSAAGVASPPAFNRFWGTPLKVSNNDTLEADTVGAGSTAVQHYVGVWLSDGPIFPAQVMGGTFFRARATGTTTLAPNAWTAVTITFDQALAAGRYAVVGMRAFSAGAILARLNFANSGFPYRPGVVAVNAVTNPGVSEFENPGALGVYGYFNNQTPPQVEFLSSSADTSEIVDLDLVKVG